MDDPQSEFPEDSPPFARSRLLRPLQGEPSQDAAILAHHGFRLGKEQLHQGGVRPQLIRLDEAQNAAQPHLRYQEGPRK